LGSLIFFEPQWHEGHKGFFYIQVELINDNKIDCFGFGYLHMEDETKYEAIPKRHEEIGREIVNCALKVHKEMGPGFLESVYEVCLAHELTQAGLSVERQYLVPVQYKNIKFDEGYRLDLLVEGCVICELKTVDKLLPVHKAQLLSYLKMTGLRLGFLLNFNVVLMKFGIKRFVL